MIEWGRWGGGGGGVTECTVYVSGYVPLTFSFLSVSFLTGWEFHGPNYLKCLKLVRWARSVLFPPVSLQYSSRSCYAYASDSGESLHCFPVGANKSYVIATSDL